MATHSNILAWEIPWTEKPGRLQSTRSRRVGHNWSNWAHMHSVLRQKWGRGLMGGALRPRVPPPGLTFTLIALLPRGRPPAPLIVPHATAITRLPASIVLAFTPKPGHITKQIYYWKVVFFFNWRSAAPVWKTESSWSPMVPLRDYENKALCICYFKSLHPAY